MDERVVRTHGDTRRAIKLYAVPVKSVVPASDNDPRRLQVRAWLSANPAPTVQEIAAAGYVAPHWPAPWGHTADAMHQLIIEEEFLAAGVTIPSNPNALLFMGPSLLIGGSRTQQDRYLPGMLAGEEHWCRLYSEPGAGSDLTAIRTQAKRSGDVFVVNGSKLWAPAAQHAAFGGLLVRTSAEPGEGRGLSYLVCPMDLDGITLRPVRDLAGGFRFNELFFDDVRIPAENLVGRQDEGLEVAEPRGRYERVSATCGAMFGNGPDVHNLLSHVDLVSMRNVDRTRLTRAYIASEALRHMAFSIAGERQQGRDSALAERARKILLERHGQELGYLSSDLKAVRGMLRADPNDPNDLVWHNAFLSAPTITIGAGATELQLDQLADGLFAP